MDTDLGEIGNLNEEEVEEEGDTFLSLIHISEPTRPY